MQNDKSGLPVYATHYTQPHSVKSPSGTMSLNGIGIKSPSGIDIKSQNGIDIKSQSGIDIKWY